MKAFILAAGFGTRLQPLTNRTPKPLLSIYGLPIIDLIIRQLKEHGVEEMVVNNHHLGQQIVDHLHDGREYGVWVIYFSEKNILGSGGGIGAAARHLKNGEFCLLHNGDIWTDIDLSEVMEKHQASQNDITMVLIDREEFNQVIVDSEGRVLDIHRRSVSSECNRKVLAYTGISVIGTHLLGEFPDDRQEDLIKIYLRLMGKGVKVGCHFAQESFWEDIGSLSSYFRLHETLYKEGHPPYVSQSAKVSPSARLEGFYSIGNGVLIEEGCFVENSIVTPGSTLQAGLSLSHAIFDNNEIIQCK